MCNARFLEVRPFRREKTPRGLRYPLGGSGSLRPGLEKVIVITVMRFFPCSRVEGILLFGTEGVGIMRCAGFGKIVRNIILGTVKNEQVSLCSEEVY